MNADDRAGSVDGTPTIDEFLNPLTVDKFFAEFSGERAVHVKGNPNKLASLFSWDSLNRVLTYPLDGLDALVMKNRAEVPRALYSQTIEHRMGTFTRIDIRALNREFRDGAMFCLRNMEVWDQRTSALSRMLERHLGGSVHVVLFAGWHEVQGFPFHYDAIDTFVAQLDGRKNWRVYEPLEKYPLFTDKPPPPSITEPYWHGDLEPGDILYVPRGWWHQAVPVGHKSLHITIAVALTNGIEFAQYVLERLKGYQTLRANLPRHGTPAERQEYMAMFRKTVNDVLDDTSLDSFLALEDRTETGRLRPSLPWSAAPDSCATPLPASGWVHWQPPRDCGMNHAGDGVVVEAFGSRFTFPLFAETVLTDIMRERKMQISDLRIRYPNVDVDDLIVQLVSSDLVAIAPDRTI